MSFLYLLEGIRCPFLDRLFSLITELGGETLYMAVAIAVYWCVSKGLGYYILTTGFVGTIANQFLKLCFRIPRPWVLDPDFSIVESARAGATGYSFPSGHTQNAFSSFGCLGMWAKGGWRALCFAIVVLIGFSRMYLGVHTPLDVGVAFVLGLVLMLALYPVFRDIEAHPGRMYGIIGGMIALTLAYLCYVELWPFPSDIDAANPNSGTIMGLVENAWGVFGAAFGPVILLSLFWRRFTFGGAVAGIVVGALVDVLWLVFLKGTGVYEIIPGFFAGLLAAVIATSAGKAPSKEVEALYDTAVAMKD